ncbi:hypothetical protein cce_4471 [Crocosphaera subtropica ATCC 51142]|uniref:Uncharacterized protein n=1 Tax=Crocosphaera subtropica (strain ATCC 51142 / BH68) TaxID=43989 RepID=B1WUG5_CROS5|nr:hypothetical protein [Crocosphaera subtropica]ACB53819.1 hypothetical protein cce_4471 [Crocosphaera subtropica ATCC 51142]
MQSRNGVFMSGSQPSQNNTQILGTFASVLGLLGIFLYFTGWIYRWAYYSYFQLELTQLSFPLRSFLFVPIQVFVGNGWASTKTIIALFLVATVIKFTLWFVEPLTVNFILPLSQPLNVTSRRRKWQKVQRSLRRYAKYFHQCTPSKLIRGLVTVIPVSLRKDLIIVIWLLIVLFWLARIQGWEDARRDAINETSTLPVFTYIFPKEDLVLGRNLDDVFIDPSLEDYRFIGDLSLFDYLRGLEDNDPSLKEPRIWRLLLENNNVIYCFFGLDKTADKKQVPAVLAIKTDKKGQVMILAPSIPKLK